MDWDKLRIFHIVAEAGSFTHAGETLNLSQSAVSRQISSLEDSLKVPLFHRHARGLILTEQGEILFQSAHEVFSTLSEAESRMAESHERPQGRLKITATVAFGSLWLTPRLKDFMAQYPDIDVTLALADTELDLSMREADVAIRMTSPRQPDLIQRHLATLKIHIFAAPEYLKEHGTPKTPQDLAEHRLIGYDAGASPPVDGYAWLRKISQSGDQDTKAAIRVNSTYGIYRACQGGLGIAALPEYMTQIDTGLVQVLPEVEGATFEAYFVYPEELRHSTRIGVFRDFLLKSVQESGFR